MAISRTSKIVATISAIAVLALAVCLFFRFAFVYSTGVNAGDINYFQEEGIVFKTYEGKMIQSGFKSAGGASKLQSNEFKFSVTDPKVAERLMRCSGKEVEVKWKRYLGTLPWRGNSQYIVTEILSEK